MSTWLDGSSRLAAARTWRPSPSGRWRSATTTSGCSAEMSWRDCASVVASPTTHTSGTSASASATRDSSSGESSTSKTVSTAPPPGALGWRLRAPRARSGGLTIVWDFPDARTLGGQALLDHVPDEVGVGLERQLRQDPAAVGAHRLGAQREVGADLFETLTASEQHQNLALPGGQVAARAAVAAGRELRGEPLGQRRPDMLTAAVHFANRADELVGRLRLHHVAVRARFDGPDGHLVLGMHAHDEDTRARPGRADALDQFEEGDARHADIEQHDVGFVGGQHGQQFGGVARFGDHAQLRVLRHELPEARAHDRVIVGDDDANHTGAGVSGKRRRTVVPPPSRGSIVNWPPHRMARSRMPSRPSAWGSSRRAGAMPTP